MFLLDTHFLIWASEGIERVPAEAQDLIGAPDSTLMFSVASLWEVAIKNGLGRPDFRVDPRLLRRGLIDNGYRELPVSGAHAVAVASLPLVHKDPFDRLLVAQATVEGVVLLTADARLRSYGRTVRVVRL